MSADRAGQRAGEQKLKEYSPLGKVKADEPLARLTLLSPVVGNKQGRLNKSDLKIDDVRSKDGWSVVRQKYADMRRVLEQHAINKENRTAADYGYATVQTEAVRNILDVHKKHVFRVVEDAQEKCPEHALIQLTSRSLQETDVRKFRDNLLRCFGPVQK